MADQCTPTTHAYSAQPCAAPALPFTGADVGILGVAGLLLTITGLALQRWARPHQEAA